MLKSAYVRQEAGKYYVYAESGKKLSRGYDSESEANNRLRQIEYFKKLRPKKKPVSEPTSSDKTAEVFESKKEQKEERKSLPYRVRIEVVAVGPDDTVYGGVYDDGTFGLYGGGASDNDNGRGGYLKDGVREFLEETGYELKNAVMCDVEPVTEEWVELPKDASEKFKSRFPQFRGSQTYFIRGDLPSEKKQSKAKGEDGKVPFKKVKLYPFDEAIEMLTNLPKKCAAPSACKGRKAAIQEAKKMHTFSKEAAAIDFIKKLRLTLAQGGLHDLRDLPEITLGRKLRSIKKIKPGLFNEFNNANTRLGRVRTHQELGAGGFKSAGEMPNLGVIDDIVPAIMKWYKNRANPQKQNKEVVAGLQEEKLVGGIADNKPDSDFDAKKLHEGMEEESEHTSSPQVQKEIAKDHLTEDKQYYDKLKLMME